jgi:uncharacterized protein HemY
LLSSALVQLRPQDPIAQRAQGLVLAKQGRWNLAAKCLETALASMPGDATMHSALASAYDQMGMPAMAGQQRRLSESAATQPTSSH